MGSKNALPLPLAREEPEDTSKSSTELLHQYRKHKMPWYIKRLITKACNLLSFAPLVIVTILGETMLAGALAICAAVAVCALGMTWFFYRAGVWKVWPKDFDITNVILYALAIPVAVTHPQWMLRWLQAWSVIGTAVFMWGSTFILPRGNFALQIARDEEPREVWNNKVLLKMTTIITVVWACAMTIMGAASAVDAAILYENPGASKAAIITFRYALGMGPFFVAFALSHVIRFAYRKRLEASLLDEMAAAQRAESASDGKDIDVAEKGGPAAAIAGVAGGKL